jgi:glycosyltransferase involved in cell wall biosynthesis
VPPRAPDAIAGAMIELATDSDRRRRMGEMARRRVETLWSLDAALAGFKALWVS